MRKSDFKSEDDFRKAKMRERERYYRPSASLYRKRRWTQEEIDILLSYQGPDRVLSATLRRSVGAIQHKRCELKSCKSNLDVS